jgi:thioredoxin-dependent peroxiredoxin
MHTKKGNEMALETGDVAPDFLLADQSGKEISLSSLKGKNVVLYFYPKDDTSGCTIEAKEFSSLIEEFAKENTVVLGMSPDGNKSHAKFATKYDLKVTLVSDEDKSALEAYGVWVEKSMYGKKYMGVERSTFLIGPEGTIKNLWRKVSAPGHANAVLEAVKSS